MSIADFKYGNNRGRLTGVTYSLFEEKEPKDTQKHSNIACFYILSHQVGQTKKNRIFYTPTIASGVRDIAEEWIALCVKEKLLPSYVNPKDVKKGITLDLDAPRSLTYVYLCLIRYLDEEPEIPLACLHLVKNEGISLYAALVLCGKSLCYNPGHNFVQGMGYCAGGGRPSLDGIKIPLREVMGLRNYIRSPEKYDQKQTSFMALANITAAGAETGIPADLTMRWTHFKFPSIRKALASTTKKQLDSALAQYKRGVEKYQKKKAEEKAAAPEDEKKLKKKKAS